MFIFTAKVNRGKITLGLLGAAAVFAVLLLTIHPTGPSTAASASVPNPKGIKTAEDRIAYLEGYGWLVAAEPLCVEELLIPEEFDESYGNYLNLQAEQGFDLTKYRGKRVKRYTYEIQNYPTGETGVQAGLLIYKNTVVGGEVLSTRLDGFIHGLALPK